MSEAICVIGCNGFVGSHVTAELLRRGYSVHGALRDPATNRGWLHRALDPLALGDNRLTLHQVELQDRAALQQAMQGCSGVVMSAGLEKQEPATVELMVAAANNTLEIAQALGINRAVFTSSTGSTNPPGGEPALKNETQHWSDPDVQLAAQKFSPAAKTLMDQAALAQMNVSKQKLRVSIINPSMITGPAFQPEPVASLKSFLAIIEGRRLSERIPNGSMSMIDVRDLAKLHVAALENADASGRYFGVKESFHWADILAAVQAAYPAYQPPAFPAAETKVVPTQFDLSRQHSLGVEVRGLEAMVAATIDELRRRGLLS